MLIEQYFDDIRQIFKNFSSFISSESVTFDNRSLTLGKIKGLIVFNDSSKLYFLEIVDSTQSYKIYYTYHYQTIANKFVFRYDNASHYEGLKTHPHHKHFKTEQNVISSYEPSLGIVLKEIINIILHKS